MAIANTGEQANILQGIHVPLGARLIQGEESLS
jgi:hypothetical protein